MNLLTYQDAQNNRALKTTAGVCSDSDAFSQYLNEAIARIYRRGDWPGTIASAQFCTQDGCVAFPEFVGRVREVNICGNPMPLKNAWYEFLLFGSGTKRGCGPSDFTTVNRGLTPVFRNIDCGKARYVRFYPRCQADLGKTVTVYGIDSNGQPLMTKVNDAWVEGMTLTLALPFVSTSTMLQRITRIRKDVTQCIVDVYQYDADNNVLIDVAHYKGRETEPAYSYFALARTGTCCQQGCGNVRQVQVLFKWALYPVVNPEDILPIQNIEAIQAMINAIKKRESGALAEANEEETIAVHAMNLESRDTDADEQLPVAVEIYGSAHLWHKRIGSNI